VHLLTNEGFLKRKKKKEKTFLQFKIASFFRLLNGPHWIIMKYCQKKKMASV